MTGSGATHAWVQVYLPGAGWRNYDPTNRITAGFDLDSGGHCPPPQPGHAPGRLVVWQPGRLPGHGGEGIPAEAR